MELRVDSNTKRTDLGKCQSGITCQPGKSHPTLLELRTANSVSGIMNAQLLRNLIDIVAPRHRFCARFFILRAFQVEQFCLAAGLITAWEAHYSRSEDGFGTEAVCPVTSWSGSATLHSSPAQAYTVVSTCAAARRENSPNLLLFGS